MLGGEPSRSTGHSNLSCALGPNLEGVRLRTRDERLQTRGWGRQAGMRQRAFLVLVAAATPILGGCVVATSANPMEVVAMEVAVARSCSCSFRWSCSSECSDHCDAPGRVGTAEKVGRRSVFRHGREQMLYL